MALMVRRLLFLTAFAACDSNPRQDPVARDLSRALEPAAAQPLDTAARRRQDELERCKFVYHDEQGLRECLVLKNGWAPQDAAREIGIYKAEIARVSDSVTRQLDSALRAQRRVRDSVHAARLEVEERARKARLRAAREREDSIYRTRDLLDGPPTPLHPDSGAWVGDDRSGAYYRATCEAAKRIPVDHRVYFWADNHAESAHLWRSKQPGC